MSTITSEIRLRIRAEGDKVLADLGAKLNSLANQATISSAKFGTLAAELKQVQATTVQSTNNLKAYSASWRELAGSVDIASKEFKQATAEAARLDAQVAKAQGTRSRRGRLAGAAQTAGAIAASGVFGGPEGLVGAGVGAAVGGSMGAAVGGAIGAQVGGIRQALGATGDYVAELSKLRIALAGVSKNQADYEKNLSNVNKLSKQFLLPLKDTTQQYTKLQASVAGAGLSTKETETVFKGISAAIIATGGTTEDLNSALRATSQVFSKGKVSAEELRQQIGERLPGAFTIFAASLNKTPQELDKALEDGKVTLNDFLKFSEELFKRYGKTASIIADAPQNAGARLTIALDRLNTEVGRFIQPIGAQFQSLATGIVNALTPAIEAFNELINAPKLLAKERLPQIQKELKEENSRLIKARRIPAIPSFLPGVGASAAALVASSTARIKQLKGEELSIKETIARTGSGTGTPPPTAGGDTDTDKAANKAAQARIQEEINKRQESFDRQEIKLLQLIKSDQLKINILKADENDQNKQATLFAANELKLGIARNQNIIKGMALQLGSDKDKLRINLEDNVQLRNAKLKANEQARNTGLKKLEIELGKKQDAILTGQTDELNKQAKVTTKELSDSKRLFDVLEDQLKIARATTPEQKIREESQARMNELAREEVALAAAKTDEVVKQQGLKNLGLQKQLEQLNLQQQLAALSPLGQFVKQASAELQNLEGVAVSVSQGIGSAIGDSVSSGIQGLVEGTANAQQIFSDFLKSIGQILIQEGAKMIATYTAIAIAKSLAGLFGGGGGGGGAQGFQMPEIAPGVGSLGPQRMLAFAEGGRPPVGKASLVGEKGPELFVPSSSGTIIPADATAAMARYQRQGGGSGGGNSSSDAMGADAATPVLSMSFETTRFLGQDYVSTDQLQAAMMATERRAAAAGAKAGAAQVTSKLQQSPSYRRQVGLR